MSRPASTYRAARRNACLRTKPKGVWQPNAIAVRRNSKRKRA